MLNPQHGALTLALALFGLAVPLVAGADSCQPADDEMFATGSLAPTVSMTDLKLGTDDSVVVSSDSIGLAEDADPLAGPNSTALEPTVAAGHEADAGTTGDGSLAGDATTPTPTTPATQVPTPTTPATPTPTPSSSVAQAGAVADSPVALVAGESVSLNAGRVSVQPDRYDLSGGVRVRSGSYMLTSEQMSYEPHSGLATIPGVVDVSLPAVRLRTADIRLNLGTDKLSTGELNFALPEASYYGRSLSADLDLDGQVLALGRTYLSRCHGDKPTWLFRATRTTIDIGNNIVRVHNPVLRVGKVPVFYFPYFSFPANGKPTSGFLAPAISYSERAGFLVNVPYYLRLSDRHDMTLSPSWWSVSGLQYNHQYRFLSRYVKGLVNLSVLDSAAPEDARPTYWGYDTRLVTEHGRHSARLYYQGVTDRQYTRRYSTGLELENFARREQITYSFAGEDLNVYLSYARWRESFHPVPGETIRFDENYQRPYVDVSYDVPGLPAGLRLRLDVEARNDELSTRSALEGGPADALIQAQTSRGRLWLEYAHALGGGNISYGGVADYLSYQRVEKADHPEGNFLHQFYVDWRWRWARRTATALHHYSVRWRQLNNPARDRVVSSIFSSTPENWIPSTIFSLNPYVGEDYVPRQQVSALLFEGSHHFGRARQSPHWGWRLGGRHNNALRTPSFLPPQTQPGTGVEGANALARAGGTGDATALDSSTGGAGGANALTGVQAFGVLTVDGPVAGVYFNLPRVLSDAAQAFDFVELPEPRTLVYHGQYLDLDAAGRFEFEYARATESNYREWFLRWHKSTVHNLYDIAWRRRASVIDSALANTRIRIIEFWYLNLGVQYNFLSVVDSSAAVGFSYISCCVAVSVRFSRNLYEKFSIGFKLDLFSGQGARKPFNWNLPAYLEE
ncbi:MAG: hypothetical protein K0U66_05965 [Gammaproteobacteria bacterium]|nr:hypothetical protein [Gammaproteobacteria bacterium]